MNELISLVSAKLDDLLSSIIFIIKDIIHCKNIINYLNII